MNNCFRLWSLGLGLLAAGPVFGAEPLPWPDETAPAESVLQKSTRLIREKAGAAPVKVPAGSEQGTKSGEPLPPKDRPEDMLQLDPFIVHGQPVPALPPTLHETRVQEFLRTGTIWQGKRFKIWFASDKGLMLTFPW